MYLLEQNGGAARDSIMLRWLHPNDPFKSDMETVGKGSLPKNYSRLPITRTFKRNRKKFELSGARKK